MLNVVLFHGTNRSGNRSQYVAEFVTEVAKKRSDLKVTLITPNSYEFKLEEEANGDAYPELKQLVKEADGYILISPEYNHGYPASLKFMLDLNLKEYIHKPVAFVGVSSGPFGGTRGIEALVSSVREMGMIACFTDVNVGMVNDEVVEGSIVDTEKWTRRVDKMLDEWIWMAEALKTARAKTSD